MVAKVMPILTTKQPKLGQKQKTHFQNNNNILSTLITSIHSIQISHVKVLKNFVLRAIKSYS